MSSFPTKILVATNGSEDADLAARAAIDLSNRTRVELHVVHARQDVQQAGGLPFMVPKYKTTQAVFQRSVKPEGYSAVRVGKSLKNKSAKQGRLTTFLIRLPGLIVTSVAQSRALTSHGRGCWFDPSITHSQNISICR